MAKALTPEEQAQLEVFRKLLHDAVDKALAADWFSVDQKNGIKELPADGSPWVQHALDGSHELIIRWRD